MKKVLFYLLLFICSFSTATFAQSYRRVSEKEALYIAQKQFTGKDVDYYIHKDMNSAVWIIFVDAEPMKGWEHDCFILGIPKSTCGSIDEIVPNIKRMSMPPNDKFTTLLVKNRYGNNVNLKPQVKKSNSTNEVPEVAQRTYAIIISGGGNMNTNYERYWNDCSFIYQTLVNKYGVPKENVYPIMSDGNNPAADMRSISGTYLSQPLDLDNDGVDEIKLAASKENVRKTLDLLSSKLRKDDHLFLYVIDHGGTDDKKSISYICLWNNERLYDYELASLLEPFTSKLVNVNVVLGQCFAGGFNDNLTKVGCVVAAASKGSESSWSCKDIPYDEFVYQWTCAVNEATHDNAHIQSDVDNNGRVTMEEAFNYARANDRRPAEHPMYVSTPVSVGEDLAFNHLAPSVDLYIKDNPEDTGKEPNLTTKEFWKSPSIWVRNKKDSIYEHQNPEYSPDHPAAFVYVRIHNRGKEDFNTNNKWLLVYWAKASTGLTAKAWKGRELYNGEYVTGLYMEPHKIDTIKAGDYKDFCISWALPEIMSKEPDDDSHYCLLARIMDTSYDDGFEEGKTYFDLPGNNDQAQKNVTIIRKEDVEKTFKVYVRNVHPVDKAYTLELIPATHADSTIYNRAKVEITMSQKIYDAWERGGFQSQDIRQTNTSSPRKVKFVSPQSKILNLSLKANEFDVIQLKFDFNRYEIGSSTYTLDLVQKDMEGNIIGGETFIVESPTVPTSMPVTPVVMSTPQNDGKYLLEVENYKEFTNLKWIDGRGETLGNNKTIEVTPLENGNTFTVAAMMDDGNVVTENISLSSNIGIKSASAKDKTIFINLKGNAPKNAAILVTSTIDGTTKINEMVQEGNATMTLDGSNLKKGIYVVSFSVNENVVDRQKIEIE